VKLFTRLWNIAMCKVCLELGFIPEACLRREYLNEDVILYSAFLELTSLKFQPQKPTNNNFTL